MRLSAAAGLALVVTLGLVSASVARTEAPEYDSISFLRGPSVYVGSFDGRRVSLVLRGNDTTTAYWEPAWSRDGRLAFTEITSYTEGNDTWALEVLGGRAPRSTVPIPPVGSGYDAQASWAPDGRRLVFVDLDSFETGGGLFTWRVGAKTSSRLTYIGARDMSPAWAPDGSEIAFVETVKSEQRLYLIRADGHGRRLVTKPRADNPNWSPDSRRIVFDDGRRIAVIGSDGKGMRYLTSAGTQSTDPAWSPDGQWIAFVRRRAGAAIGDIWLMNPSGGGQRRLMRNAYQPAWKP